LSRLLTKEVIVRKKKNGTKGFCYVYTARKSTEIKKRLLNEIEGKMSEVKKAIKGLR
jgi:predicted transcriptional regulator